jgi:excinuclease ABC subunit A
MSKRPPDSLIRLRGVRHNNLKGFDLDLPLHRLIVITGLSGSGKSSLAFDTLFAEGQRRYIETFSPYARQFFDRMDKPRVDRVEGIPPAIAIEQRNAIRTTRSTVGTMTEICDYLKAVWPHLAQLHCRGCGQPVRKDPPQSIWQALHATERTRNAECLITFALPLSEKLSLEESLALVAKQGYQRLWIEGTALRLEDALARFGGDVAKPDRLTVLQDRIRLAPANRARLVEACEQAYHFGKGKLSLLVAEGAGWRERRFSNRRHCAECDLEYAEPTPALFSFNHPLGACPACKGFGRIIAIDYQRALPDRTLTLAEGAVKPWRTGFSAECQGDLRKFCRGRGIRMDVPFRDLPPEHQDWVIRGDPDYGTDEEHEWPRAWYGVKGYFRWLESRAYKMHVRVLLSRYRAYSPCPDCGGQRLRPEALLYRLTPDAGGPHGQRAALTGAPSTLPLFPPSLSLADLYRLPLLDTLALVQTIARRHRAVASDPLAVALNEVRSRLRYLVDVGLGYLTLDRPSRSLSGGETERVNLTTCLGTKLVNTLYVLDEPSVGLHPHDTARLVRVLEQLRDLGNTVVVVEHEARVIRAADQLVDLGPGRGESGGELVFQGTPKEILRSKTSLTGQYLSGRRGIAVPQRRPVNLASGGARPSARGEGAASLSAGVRISSPSLTLSGARLHNLKDLTVSIPVNRFVCLTGVSGSGKTTLACEVLHPLLVAQLQPAGTGSGEAVEDAEGEEAPSTPNGPSAALTGAELLGRAVMVDPSPIGKTPRSNPAVYVGAFDDIRELFAQSEPARQRGLNASAFSFNSSQGQCERCRGAGFEKIEMQFLSDVFIRCPDCDGRRYRPHVLEVELEAPSPNPVPRHARPGSRRGDPAELDVRRLTAAATVLPQATRTTPQGRTSRPAVSNGATARTGWSIADVLDATVDEAMGFLGALAESPPARRAAARLGLLQEVGLGYLRLGQPINTLSGGESQRLKLVGYLADSPAVSAPGLSVARQATSGQAALPTLFLFDEPTTGLHFEDVRVLLAVFQRLVEAGHSVLVVEHNLDVIKSADWVIDLGPEAGDRGGQVVVQGPPETVAACERSHTGKALREVLAGWGVGRAGHR